MWVFGATTMLVVTVLLHIILGLTDVISESGYAALMVEQCQV
jgi:hypothetical protein